MPSPTGRAGWMPWLVLFLVAGVALVHADFWRFLCDDAYISFRYAQNLADHGTLAYNLAAPHEWVEGYSNLLWVLWLAAGRWLTGVAPDVLAPVSTQVALFVATLLACRLALALELRRRGVMATWDSIAVVGGVGVLLAASPEWVVWGHGGLETALATAMTLAACLQVVRGRWWLAGALAGLAGLCRLDALVPLGMFVVTDLAVGGRARWPGWRRLAGAAAWAAVPLLAQLWWRHHVYGEWLPNTWYVKQFGGLLRETYGVWYVGAWAHAVGLPWLAVVVVGLRSRHLVLLVPIFATLVYAWAVGGDFMAYSRFLMVATGLWAVLVVGTITEVVALVARRVAWLQPPQRSAAVVLVVAVGLAGLSADHARERWRRDMAQPEGWLDGRWEGVHAMDRFARDRVHVGRWLHEHIPGETWVTVGAAGALPYASGVQVVDLYGLVDPWPRRVASLRPSPRGRPGHQLVAPLAELRVRDPDLYCHVGHVGPRVPAAPSAAVRGLGPGYRWACAAPGPRADLHAATGERDLGYYCCLRPRGRVVGPFTDLAGPTGSQEASR